MTKMAKIKPRRQPARYPADNALIAGFLINKFRGDVPLFEDGYRLIAQRTTWPSFGVVPFLADAAELPTEDALDLPSGVGVGAYKIAWLTLSRIANFDALDPLAQEQAVTLCMIRACKVVPGDTDLIIIPGSKSTCGDLAYLRAQGWYIDIAVHVRRGGFVLGIGGGYQMLGQWVRDPLAIEGAAADTPRLGLLDIETLMSAEKTLTRVSATYVEPAASLRL